MDALRTLAEQWRERAATFRAHACEPAARAYEMAAAELEAELRTGLEESLSLAEAAVESGYSRRRLRELVADGSLPNAGRKGAPRIRRADLPRRVQAAQVDSYNPAADARNLAARLVS